MSSARTHGFKELLMGMGFVTESQIETALSQKPGDDDALAEMLIAQGFMTRSQLQRAFTRIASNQDKPEEAPPLLGEILVDMKVISRVQLDDALEVQTQTGQKLGEILSGMQFASREQIVAALDTQKKLHDTQKKNGLESLGANTKTRVLVVDDSPLALAFISQGLEEHGYSISCIHDSKLALKEMQVFRPHIVVSDLEMPDVDGEELCRRIKLSQASPPPVIILTAKEDEEVRVQGLKAGADDYCSKGVSMNELSARIQGILRRSQETQKLRKLFARYTSDEVVDQVLRNGDVVLSGEKREVTVLFADIRDFTSMTETMSPDAVVDLLNNALARMADAVIVNGGTLDKFLGDGLMAVFGAPVRHNDDLDRAFHSAMRMLQEVEDYNAKRPSATKLQLGIGINSGTAIVGSLGSSRRSEYTCIGDVVNVAARFCSIARPGEILMGASAGEELKKHGEDVEELVPMRLKGKAQEVRVFRSALKVDSGK